MIKPELIYSRYASAYAGVLICVAVLFGLVPNAVTSAQAQITFEIGISRDKAVRRMVDQGYSQIQITRKGFKTIEANACQNGVRYEVRVSDGYRIKNEREIGACRRTVSAQSIEQNLENNGYTRIVIDNQNGNFVAIACRNENRVRITFSRQGEVLQRRKIGTCEDIFQPNDVRKVLREAGYNRIRFTDRQLPWYKAEACRNGRKLELLLTRFGDIRRSQRIGRCDPPVDPRRLAQYLETKGYDRVQVISDRLPVYKARACFKNDRVDLELDRFGAITGRKILGKCVGRMSEDQIVKLLEREGFTRINIDQMQNGNFRVSACFEGREKFATLSRYGELLNERDGETCDARSLVDVNNALSERGYSNMQYFVEGCRRGRKFRIELNASGDRIGRERIGNC